jgi:hypothetical protein
MRMSPRRRYVRLKDHMFIKVPESTLNDSNRQWLEYYTAEMHRCNARAKAYADEGDHYTALAWRRVAEDADEKRIKCAARLSRTANLAQARAAKRVAHAA